MAGARGAARPPPARRRRSQCRADPRSRDTGGHVPSPRRARARRCRPRGTRADVAVADGGRAEWGACAPTPRGTPPTGSPSGPGSTSARTSSARSCSGDPAAGRRWSWSRISPSAATRQVEQARTADLADAELRRRGGFLSTARRRPRGGAGRRDARPSWPTATRPFRFSGYVTVTAAERRAARRGLRGDRAGGRPGRLELRRLYGDQERALRLHAALGRGLVGEPRAIGERDRRPPAPRPPGHHPPSRCGLPARRRSRARRTGGC